MTEIKSISGSIIMPDGAVRNIYINDSPYVLTAVGIQFILSFGLTDVIPGLPDDSRSVSVAVTDSLCVETEKGIYRRELCGDCTDFEVPKENSQAITIKK